MSPLKTITMIAVVLVAVTAFGQANPSMRADRKISGSAYRSHAAVVQRHYGYQPTMRTYARPYTPVVTTPVPAPAPTVVADTGTRTYRSFSFEPTPAPAYVAPATTYRGPVCNTAPAPMIRSMPMNNWRADRKIR